MKTDRELLELAAKAAGYEGGITEYENGYCEMGLTNHFKPNGSNVWRPLTDDGDALRLAVKLRLVIDMSTGADIHVQYPIGKAYHPLREDDERDPYAATRRAIVRAAAAIGETL